MTRPARPPRRATRRRTLVGAALTALLSLGLASPTRAADPPNLIPAAALTNPARPVAVRIPGLGVAARVVPVALTERRVLVAPADERRVGWWVGSPAPGGTGPSVLVGHVEQARRPGAFVRLRTLRPGARVDVVRADGSVARYRVDHVEQHRKSAFPTVHVYGPTTGGSLRLITCGGPMARATREHRDNVIVFADLVGVVPAPQPGARA